MKKIAVVGTVGLPACYGGFETLVENLTLNANENLSYMVFCSNKHYDKKIRKHNDAQLVYLPLSANGAQSIPYDILSLFKCLFSKPDVTLILGVSGAVFLPIYRLFSKSKIVTNIDGLEWKRDKWSNPVRKFLKFSEKLAVKYSDVVVCDNKAIGEYVELEYGQSNSIIAYGGDHVLVNDNFDLVKKDYYFSVCRIEPENNVHLILRAFAKTNERLKFVGNWDSSSYGKELKNKYGVLDNIEIMDPIYNLGELHKLRGEAKAYLHGHSAGGTNPSLVEAMHFGIPIMAFDCDFNRYTTEDCAFYFEDEEGLLSLLDNNSSDDLLRCGDSMLSLAKRKYTWATITRQYESVYD